MNGDAMLTLNAAAARIGRSERTLWRWQALGLIVIHAGGFVLERDLVRAEAEIRRRRVLARHATKTREDRP